MQLIVNAINEALGNYGKTLSFDNSNMMRQGLDNSVKNLISELNAGQVNILMVHDCNPVYDHAMGAGLAEAMAKAEMSISFAGNMNETAEKCNFVCPDHHFLESWNDAEPKKVIYLFLNPLSKIYLKHAKCKIHY